MQHRQAKAGAASAALVAAVAGMMAAGPRTTWDGVFTAEQALAGEAVYVESCSTCHGSDLEGGEDAPALVGAPFSAVWEGRPLADLVGRMQAKMPQGAPGSLDRLAYTEIAAFVLHRNGFPGGNTPLPAMPGALNEIRYLSQPPK